LYGIRADRVNCTGAYLFNWLQTDKGSADLQNRATGTTVVGIKQSELRKIIILCPSAKVLKSYDLFACGYLGKMDANDVSNMDLAKLRDTLLPKLISGELRIPDAKKLVKDAL
jgi:type I restriction enzyme S subunit